MKGKKCIKLLVLSLGILSVLLPVILPINNANAIDKKKNVQNRYINSVEWYYQGRDADNNNASGNMSANLFNNSILDRITMYANGHNVATLINLKLNLRDNLTISKTKYFSSKIYFLVGPGLNTNNFNVPLCPRGQGYVVIDECNISHIENISEIYRIRDAALDPNDNFSYYQVFTNAKYYYVMELVGHYQGDETTLSQLAFYNNFYTLYNEYPAGFVDGVEVYLYFSPIEQFEYIESPTDEANKKELEDRNNLETQQTESEESAEDSSEDLGGATTNITGIVSTFLGNLQNLNANQCTLPEIAAYGFSIGQLNLCTFRPPSWVQGISSAVVSLMMLGLAVHLFKRIMGIAKGLAGSK